MRTEISMEALHQRRPSLRIPDATRTHIGVLATAATVILEAMGFSCAAILTAAFTISIIPLTPEKHQKK